MKYDGNDVDRRKSQVTRTSEVRIIRFDKNLFYSNGSVSNLKNHLISGIRIFNRTRKNMYPSDVQKMKNHSV